MPTKRIIVHSGARPDVEYVQVLRSGEPHSGDVYEIDRDEEIVLPEDENSRNEPNRLAEQAAPSLALVLPGGNQQFKPVAVSIESEEYDRNEPRDASAQEGGPGRRLVRVKHMRFTFLGTVRQKHKA